MKVISHILLLFDVKHMLFFSKRSAKQFRQIGQNCIGKHRERSRNVFFTLFFFPLGLIFQTLFCLVNPLPEFSVTVTVRQNDSVRAIEGRAGYVARLHRTPPCQPKRRSLTLENTTAATETTL